MARRKPDPTANPTLPGTAKREPAGTVERAAASDLRALRDLDLLGPGSDALAAAYRRAAREVDRAERRRDAWAGFAAIRELRSTRLELAPMSANIADDDLDNVLAEVAALLNADRNR